jgi:hypothetical protein
MKLILSHSHVKVRRLNIYICLNQPIGKCKKIYFIISINRDHSVTGRGVNRAFEPPPTGKYQYSIFQYFEQSESISIAFLI